MNQLNRFFLRVVLWLPICFAAWYFSSILFVRPLASVVSSLMIWLFPALIEQVQQQGNHLNVVTRLVVQVPRGTGMASGDIMFTLNPLVYGYCIPMYSALVFATKTDEMKQVLYWLVGILILIAVQVFGISSHILKTLAFMNDDVRAQLGFAPWNYELIALAYQFGYLILPPVAPIVIWFGQFQQTVITTLDE